MHTVNDLCKIGALSILLQQCAPFIIIYILSLKSICICNIFDYKVFYTEYDHFIFLYVLLFILEYIGKNSVVFVALKYYSFD